MRSSSVSWLVSANIVWLLAGLVAYATRFPMIMGAALASAVAVPGILALRREAHDDERLLWADRALSFAMGTWAVLIVVVLLPLITLEDGGNLWAQRGYWLIALVVANGGFLLLNTSALLALAGPNAMGSVRVYGLFHVTLLLVAAWALWTMDGAMVELKVAGEVFRAFDPRMAPAFAALPGLTWALAIGRSRPAA